jgi:hypothetical protein
MNAVAIGIPFHRYYSYRYLSSSSKTLMMFPVSWYTFTTIALVWGVLTIFWFSFSIKIIPNHVLEIFQQTHFLYKKSFELAMDIWKIIILLQYLQQLWISIITPVYFKPAKIVIKQQTNMPNKFDIRYL